MFPGGASTCAAVREAEEEEEERRENQDDIEEEDDLSEDCCCEEEGSGLGGSGCALKRSRNFCTSGSICSEVEEEGEDVDIEDGGTDSLSVGAGAFSADDEEAQSQPIVVVS